MIRSISHVSLIFCKCIADPTIFETGMQIVYSSWNHNGTILAVTGSTVLADEVKESNIVQFFSPFGEVGAFHFYNTLQLSCKEKFSYSLFCHVLFLVHSTSYMAPFFKASFSQLPMQGVQRCFYT